MRTIPIAILAAVFATAGATRAEEGMWMPKQLPALAARLKAAGFEGDPAAFADLTGQPMGAMVSLGGCSASFVSADGLIVTNHHCVQGALQFNSTPERNLIEDGFLARTLSDEPSNGPGSRATVVTQVVEVTDDLTAKMTPGLTDRQRYDVVERYTKERTAACEKDGSRCRIASFFGGLTWYEIKQLELRDVRLVYAPARGIGNFGGETDNWQWPRHTGDFSFYRAYTGKDGKPATYAPTNVPYHPKHWLKVSPKGASPGDLVFVVGYPGSTERHQTYAEIEQLTQWQLPRSIRRSTEQLAILNDLATTSPELAIKLETRIRGLNNTLTKDKGVLLGLTKGGILDKKLRQQKSVAGWIAANPERRMLYSQVLPDLDAMTAEIQKTRERDAVFAAIRGSIRGGSVVGAAGAIVDVAINRPKKDADREPEFQERNLDRIGESLDRMQRTLDKTADRAILRYQLLEASRLGAGERIEVIDTAVALRAGMSEADATKAVDAFCDRLYAGTKLFDKTYRLSLLKKSTKELAASGDTAIDFATALIPFRDQLREVQKTREGARYRLVPRYLQVLLQMSGGLLAPDANGTLRVTYGTVTGVDSRDGLFYKPQTTLAGVLEKNSSDKEFQVPAREIEAAGALRKGRETPFLDPALKDVPVNFLATLDTTNGSSGSPVLNARGELVGLSFDGTYDTVASDVIYDAVRTRAINVDVRYMLWVMTEVDGAERILSELK